MRKIKRWLNRRRAERQLRPRCAEIIEDLWHHFDLPSPPHLTPGGALGHDSTFFVTDAEGGQPFAVLRLVNPYKTRVPPAGDQPFILEPPSARLDREWRAYTHGHPSGLTPKPLWRAPDALVCEYLPFRPLMDQIGKTPGASWDILAGAARRIGQLHAAGMTHMDMTLSNMLGNESGDAVFVDFEYAPAFHISPPLQRLYDHLRLVESAWKYLPPEEKGNFNPWLSVFSETLDDEMREGYLSLLTPALNRIFQDNRLAPAIMSIISRGDHGQS
jgi:hypothetical protein